MARPRGCGGGTSRVRARAAPSSRSARSAGARRSSSRSRAGSVVAIDPHAGSDRGPQEIAAEAERGDADHSAFMENLRSAGVSDRVRHVRKFSADAHGDVAGALSLLYVDGAHRFRRPARTCRAGAGG